MLFVLSGTYLRGLKSLLHIVISIHLGVGTASKGP